MPTTILTVQEVETSKDGVTKQEVSAFVSTKYTAGECLAILKEFEEDYREVLSEGSAKRYYLKVIGITQIPETLTDQVMDDGYGDVRWIDSLTK